MTIIRQTKVADIVLSIVDNITPDEYIIYAEPYQNGREHGWSLTKGMSVSTKQVVFSESRHSDNIVVYTGHMEDFSSSGNVPSDKMYIRRVFFHPDSFMECASYIYDYLFGDD